MNSNLPANFSDDDYDKSFDIDCPRCNGKDENCYLCLGEGTVDPELADDFKTEIQELNDSQHDD